MTSFLVVAGACIENISRLLDWVLYIYYPLCFWKNTREVAALIDTSSKVNKMPLVYPSKISFQVHQIDIGAQKLNSSIFKTFEMILASFQVEDKLGKACFFQKTFLLTDISIEMVLKMLFITFSNVDIQFAKKKVSWRFYTTVEALSTNKQVELINKKKSVKIALYEESQTFVVHVSTLQVSEITIHSSQKAQIFGRDPIQIAAFK